MLSFSAQVQFRNGTKWASKNQASSDCHKNSRQSNIPGAFMKNEHQRPTAEVSILLFMMWGYSGTFGVEGQILSCTRGTDAPSVSYKHKLFTEVFQQQLLWNHIQKETSCAKDSTSDTILPQRISSCTMKVQSIQTILQCLKIIYLWQ